MKKETTEDKIKSWEKHLDNKLTELWYQKQKLRNIEKSIHAIEGIIEGLKTELKYEKIGG